MTFETILEKQISKAINHIKMLAKRSHTQLKYQIIHKVMEPPTITFHELIRI